MELTLAQLRRELDSADDLLVEALRRRLHYVERIAEHKKRHGLPAVDPGREAVVASTVLSGAGGDERVAVMHRAIVLICRAEVERIVG